MKLDAETTGRSNGRRGGNEVRDATLSLILRRRVSDDDDNEPSLQPTHAEQKKETNHGRKAKTTRGKQRKNSRPYFRLLIHTGRSPTDGEQQL